MKTAANTALIAAIVLGFAADRLLPEGPIGPGFALWITLFGGVAVFLTRRHQMDCSRETAIAAVIAVAAASISVFRAAEALHVLALLVIVTAASIPILRAREFHFGRTSPLLQALGLALVGAHAGLGALALLAQDVERGPIAERSTRVPLIALRGLLLALPLLFVFTALFASADRTFDFYIQSVLDFGAKKVVQHLVFALAFAWITAGLLRGLLPRENSILRKLPAPPSAPGPEVGVSLGAIAGLFAAFLLLQGETAGATLANEARTGFFQLVVASALVLPLLITAHSVTQTATPPARRAIRIISVVLVVLVYILLASALQRMNAYTAAFGLTELRVYTQAFMAWLAVVFAWLLLTTMRDRPNRFSAGPVIAGFVAVLALAVINPDRLIAHVNLEHRKAGAELDGAYLTRLSADAAPIIAEHIKQLPVEQRCKIITRWKKGFIDDWRRYNAARANAYDIAIEVAPGLPCRK